MSDPSQQARQLRRTPRRKIFLPVEVRCGGRALRAHLLDLSTSGGLLHLTEPPAVGASLTLVAQGLSRSARVVWADGARMGIAFTLPMMADQVDALLGVPAAAAGRIGG